MAGAAGDIAHVLAGDDLGEPFRFGGIGFMAADAESRCIWFGGLVGRRILGVRGQCAMTGFAAEAGMARLAFHGGDIVVTGFARLTAGEGGWPGGDLFERGGAVMAILSEGGRDHGAADQQEKNQKQGSQRGQPNQMPCFSEESFHFCIAVRAIARPVVVRRTTACRKGQVTAVTSDEGGSGCAASGKCVELGYAPLRFAAVAGFWPAGRLESIPIS